MTKEEFQELSFGKVVLLDGATGSNLTKAGMPKGVSTELWVLEHPECLINLQKAYVEAGSRILYAPTFSCNPYSMKAYGAEDQIRELNRRLTALSKEAAGGRAYVAGDMTTTGKMLEPRGEMSYEVLYATYQAQAEALFLAGVDLFAVETMLGVEETTVAVDAIQSVCDLPIFCTMSVESDGSAYFGGTVMEAVETLQDMGVSAVGVNCSLGPDQLEAVVASMKKLARIPIIAKPNAGMPKILETGEAVYDMDAQKFASSMKKLVEAGASIIGGCCGTTPEYIREVKKILK
jgi:5-methyltetrahydrofolate--homocysteine methyltransferase